MRFPTVTCLCLVLLAAGCRHPTRPSPTPVEPTPPSASVPPPVAPPEVPAKPPDPFGGFDAPLAAIGLTRETCRLDRDDMGFFGGDTHRQHLFDVWMNSPFKVPPQAANFAQAVSGNAENLNTLVLFAGIRLKIGVRRGLIGNPLDALSEKAAQPDGLLKAIRYCGGKTGRPVGAGDEARISAAQAKLPPAVAKALALLVYQSADSYEWRMKAFAEFPGDALPMLFRATQRYVATVEEEQNDRTVESTVEQAATRVDFLALHAGALDLAGAIDRVVKDLRGETLTISEIVVCPTPLGDLVVGTSGNDTLARPDPALCVLDPGGDDQLGAAPATPDADHPISIVIDLGGNDTYVNADKSRGSAASATCGYAFLVDCGGNDTYAGIHHCEGSGAYGVAALLDLGGDDRYAATTHGQGAGSYGIGILSDVAGADRYDAYQLGQGFGYVLGCGLLVDKAGDDQYTANDTDIRFASAQSKEHNTSMCQGVGFGKRADYTDGHSLAGGIGMLVDAAGNDKYSCGIFGQGCAYWYGIGLLVDRGGDDEYRGVWYVQASCAHFGIGVLVEQGGNDHYIATMNMAQGAGHDWSLGFLIDDAGNDIHEAPNLSLGGGNDNGMGIFWDRGGDDIYKSSGTTLGQSSITAPEGNLRRQFPCIGVFLDEGGGNDTYPEGKPCAKNGAGWTQAGPDASRKLEAEKGAGGDR